MKANYQDCLNRLLKDEGGYTNHPLDPGGPTNFGITLTDYRKYINKNGVAEDVKNMSVTDAKSIYKSKYWDAINGDTLPSGVDYTCFDYAVNSGLGRPRKALQRFKSLSGTKLIDAINDERLAFLRGLSTFPTFGKGWTRRVQGVRDYSKVLAKRDATSGTAAGAGVAGIGVGLSQYFHNHEILIISSTVALAVIIGAAIYAYKNKGK